MAHMSRIKTYKTPIMTTYYEPIQKMLEIGKAEKLAYLLTLISLLIYVN